MHGDIAIALKRSGEIAYGYLPFAAAIGQRLFEPRNVEEVGPQPFGAGRRFF
jgi:hypothetical protein